METDKNPAELSQVASTPPLNPNPPHPSFQCKFCNISVPLKADWINHLIDDRHQVPARHAWGNQTVKSKCLVVFSKSCSQGRKILYKLSYEGGAQGYSISNFLWWPDRPSISIIELGTREEVETAHVVGTTQFSEDEAEIVMADNLSQLEFLAIVPDRVAKRLKCEEGTSKQSANRNPRKRRKRSLHTSSTTEDAAGGPKKTVKLSSGRANESAETCTDYHVKMLAKLAVERGWSGPTYSVINYPDGKKSKTWKAIAFVNNVEWASGIFSKADDDREKVKNQVAHLAYQSIMSADAQECQVAENKEGECPNKMVQVGHGSPERPLHDEIGNKFNYADWNVDAEYWEENPVQNSVELDILDNGNEISKNMLVETTKMEISEETENKPMKEPSDDNPILRETASKVKREPGEPETPPILSNQAFEPSSQPIQNEDCPIKLLEEISDSKGWKKPQYILSRQLKKPQYILSRQLKKPDFLEFEYMCRLIVSEVEYQPCIGAPKQNSENDAIRYIALECLEKFIETNVLVKKEVLEDGIHPSEHLEQPAVGKEKYEMRHQFQMITATFLKNMPNEPNNTPLELQYWAIQKLVMAPTYNIKAENIRVRTAIRDLQKMLEKRARGCYVDAIGNWPLKFKPCQKCTTDEPLFCLYTHDEEQQADDLSSSTFISNKKLLKIFGKGYTNKSYWEKAIFVPAPESGGHPANKIRILHKTTGLHFSVTISKSSLLHLQTGRLLEYMCTFDVRCHHLIVLAQYWADLNSIRFANAAHGPESEDIPHHLPERQVLPWMVIFFLCQMGILPTPREIQQMPHQILRDTISGCDIGFSPDLEFVQNWTSPHSGAKRFRPGELGDNNGRNLPLEVMELFVQFLRFHEEARPHKDGKEVLTWILNMRDAEWVDKQQVRGTPSMLSCGNILTWCSNMSLDEIQKLQKLFDEAPANTSENEEEMVEVEVEKASEGYHWYVTNPFIVTSLCPVSPEITVINKIMERTSERLHTLLSRQQSQGGIDGPAKEKKFRVHTLEDALLDGRKERVRTRHKMNRDCSELKAKNTVLAVTKGKENEGEP